MLVNETSLQCFVIDACEHSDVVFDAYIAECSKLCCVFIKQVWKALFMIFNNMANCQICSVKKIIRKN